MYELSLKFFFQTINAHTTVMVINIFFVCSLISGGPLFTIKYTFYISVSVTRVVFK